MNGPCLIVRHWRRFALPLVPVLAWAALLAVVPTDWARTRLVQRLARATGRTVTIGELRLGPLGDLKIIGLAIAEPANPGDPWLVVDEARVDVHLGQLLTGCCDPTEVVIEGARLRLRRKQDGSIEIGDLIADRSETGRGKAKSAASEPGGSVALRISGAAVRIIDEPGGNRVDLVDVEARAAWGRRVLSVEEVKGRLNGGTFAAAGRLDRDPASPRFEVEFQASRVEVDRGLPILGLFVPVVAGATDGVGGQGDFALALKGHGATRSEIRRSLRGHGSVRLEPIDLDGSKFLAELDVLGDWPKGSRVGSVSADFQVDQGRISTEDLTIRASQFPFVLAGWTDFDGRFDYAAQVDKIAAKLPKEARAWLPELKVNFDQLAGLRMFGSIDHVEVTIHGHPLTGDPDRPDSERARFRDTARRIRDRFFR
jgi:AsmA protein